MMADLNAQNTYCAAVYKAGGQRFAVSVIGTWAGTITTQRSRDGNTWQDVDNTTSNYERDGISAAGFYWRAGFKTGGYTSGTATVNVY
jgi:hypothetical protein